VPAIRKALKLAGLTLDQIDLVELNEAFAAQVLACLRELPIDPDRLNVNGGAIALGHPLGCTGAKLTTTLLYEMQRRKRALRPGHDVRRRRHGRGGILETHVASVFRPTGCRRV
jgi:acetyl-CoA acetyltransferase